MSAARRDGTTPNGACALCGQRAVVTYHTIAKSIVITACAECVAVAERNLANA